MLTVEEGSLTTDLPSCDNSTKQGILTEGGEAPGLQTCQSEQIFNGEPHDANSLDHGQLRVVLRISGLVDDGHRRDGVGRHSGR